MASGLGQWVSDSWGVSLPRFRRGGGEGGEGGFRIYGLGGGGGGGKSSRTRSMRRSRSSSRSCSRINPKPYYSSGTNSFATCTLPGCA